jgi:hypothetical protein
MQVSVRKFSDGSKRSDDIDDSTRFPDPPMIHPPGLFRETLGGFVIRGI